MDRANPVLRLNAKMIHKAARDIQRPADGIWKQDPVLLEAYATAKAARDITQLPIGERFEERLDCVKTWAEKFRGVRFWITTNPKTYIDNLTPTEEPEFSLLKWRKKTWDGIYTSKGKNSDIDMNPFWIHDNRWFTAGECRALICSDPKRIVPHLVLEREDIKIDVYAHKSEEGFWLT